MKSVRAAHSLSVRSIFAGVLLEPFGIGLSLHMVNEGCACALLAGMASCDRPEICLTADFDMLCTQTKDAAFVLLEEWDAEFEIDVVDEVLKQALTATLPRLEELDGEWIMQMIWQVPDLLVDTEYSDGMDVNAATQKAVHFRIGSLIRDDVSARAEELGLVSGQMRI